MMIEDVKIFLEEYFTRYKQIVKQYYPAHKKNGFTEQNMTVCFASTVEKYCEDSFAWYEVPVLDSNQKYSNHIDAVIFDTVGNNIFLVESKRFSTPARKIKELGNDINRMCDPAVISTICEGLKNQMDFPNVFGIVLADVWPSQKGEKEKIFESWKAKIFLCDYSDKLELKQNVMPLYHHAEYDIKGYKHVLLALAFEVHKS